MNLVDDRVGRLATEISSRYSLIYGTSNGSSKDVTSGLVALQPCNHHCTALERYVDTMTRLLLLHTVIHLGKYY